jgi:DNA invertase Pin-like site-specific DNA recombinase
MVQPRIQARVGSTIDRCHQCPEKGSPKEVLEAYILEAMGRSDSVSAKEYIYGRRRRPSKISDGTQTALYLRVSTAEQKPDLQYDGLRAYASRVGLQIVRDYCDTGVSGRREGRPQLNALMTAARNREIDCVLVWKFDRFARSTRHLLAALEEFNHLGVRFVSVQDQIDTDSPMGRAMFIIIGAMAELESSLISERVTAGMRAAETRGKHLGRPSIPITTVRLDVE